ncbi:MAG: hypothetical protein ABIJ97_10630 [Bacteroidota bacterium]
MKKLKYLTILTAIFLFVSCQYDPYAIEYTTDEPVDADITGTYLFEKQTVDNKIKSFIDSTNGSAVNPKIEIFEDGKYKADNLPYFYSLVPVYSGLITGEGTWEKSVVGLVGNGTNKLDDHWGLILNGLPQDLQNAGFMNKKPPFKIIFGFGDPDAGKVMIFKKQ